MVRSDLPLFNANIPYKKNDLKSGDTFDDVVVFLIHNREKKSTYFKLEPNHTKQNPWVCLAL